MKKRLLTAALAALVLGVSGCGGTADKPAEKPAERPADSNEIIVGRLAYAGISEEQYNLLVKNSHKQGEPEITTKFFDTFSNMKLALDSGQIDEIVINESTAKYMAAWDTELEVKDYNEPVTVSFSMLLKADNKELCKKLSDTITEMKDDGTFDDLETNYLYAYIGETYPKPVKCEHKDEWKKLTVAVTGDLPQMDFVSVSGEPAGYSTAVAAELGKRLGYNIEFLNIDSGARATALSTDSADVVFWSVSVAGESFNTENIDIPDGTIITAPYIEQKNMIVTKKSK